MRASHPRVLQLNAVGSSAVNTVSDTRMCRILDNLPVAMVRWRPGTAAGDNLDSQVKYYDRGYPVGYFMPSEVRPFTACSCEHTLVTDCTLVAHDRADCSEPREMNSAKGFD